MKDLANQGHMELWEMSLVYKQEVEVFLRNLEEAVAFG